MKKGIKPKLTARLFMQLIGTNVGRIIHPDVWVLGTFRTWQQHSNWIFTDVRFPNELQAIRDRGGIIIRITRANSFSIKNKMKKTT